MWFIYRSPWIHFRNGRAIDRYVNFFPSFTLQDHRVDVTGLCYIFLFERYWANEKTFLYYTFLYYRRCQGWWRTKTREVSKTTPFCSAAATQFRCYISWRNSRKFRYISWRNSRKFPRDDRSSRRDVNLSDAKMYIYINRGVNSRPRRAFSASGVDGLRLAALDEALDKTG